MKIQTYHYTNNHSKINASEKISYLIEVKEEDVYNNEPIGNFSEELLLDNPTLKASEYFLKLERSFLFKGLSGLINFSLINTHEDLFEYTIYGSHDLMLFRNNNYELLSRNKDNRELFGTFIEPGKQETLKLLKDDRLILCSKSLYDNFSLKAFIKLLDKENNALDIQNKLKKINISEGYSFILFDVL